MHNRIVILGKMFKFDGIPIPISLWKFLAFFFSLLKNTLRRHSQCTSVRPPCRPSVCPSKKKLLTTVLNINLPS